MCIRDRYCHGPVVTGAWYQLENQPSATSTGSAPGWAATTQIGAGVSLNAASASVSAMHVPSGEGIAASLVVTMPSGTGISHCSPVDGRLALMNTSSYRGVKMG